LCDRSRQPAVWLSPLQLEISLSVQIVEHIPCNRTLNLAVIIMLPRLPRSIHFKVCTYDLSENARRKEHAAYFEGLGLNQLLHLEWDIGVPQICGQLLIFNYPKIKGLCDLN
jgi:hypothetical protein